MQNSQEKTCVRASFLIKQQAACCRQQVFSCEFCEIFKNTFFTEHLWTIASEEGSREYRYKHRKALDLGKKSGAGRIVATFYNIYNEVAGLLQYLQRSCRLRHRFFPANLAKCLRIHFLQNTSGYCFCILLEEEKAFFTLQS